MRARHEGEMGGRADGRQDDKTGSREESPLLGFVCDTKLLGPHAGAAIRHQIRHQMSGEQLGSKRQHRDTMTRGWCTIHKRAWTMGHGLEALWLASWLEQGMLCAGVCGKGRSSAPSCRLHYCCQSCCVRYRCLHLRPCSVLTTKVLRQQESINWLELLNTAAEEKHIGE